MNRAIGGQGPAIVLIHGLFGDLDNLKSLGQSLQSDYRVIRVDVPNHGNSPHWDTMDYPALADAMVAMLDEEGMDKALFIGHSMGGKIAMATALCHPERVSGVVAADISPVAYPHRHQLVFQALTSLPLDGSCDRRQALVHMKDAGVDEATAQFLLKSFRRTDTGFGWKMNIDGLKRNYDALIGWPFHTISYSGPTLFVRGGDSDYVKAEHKDAILAQFPAVQLKSIAATGHWLHAQKPELFNRLVKGFVDSLALPL
ncbi:alpha/beta fold hydrolase [Shewanella sedimentimangrovi]|uniref:alpha/beta fold hydrolase n=1 Tax=Shewanella sedimentimangrovi TaxID=2814293 RepID=UPI0038999C06